jgi:hypothetical protein
LAAPFFGLKDVNELPSMEEFEKLLADSFQSDMLSGEGSLVEAASILPSTIEDASSDKEDPAEIGEDAETDFAAEEAETHAATKPE